MGQTTGSELRGAMTQTFYRLFGYALLDNGSDDQKAVLVIVFSAPTAPWQRPGRKRAPGWREIKGFSRQVSRD
ncbi:hypothetical protein ALC56_10090 [Trachymyrmex septentrionalis]|uniref:Uncharacterized protein n=1 Tax=Trachymyrmex septentrionalis TaxID=34720 RepID=A0A195F4Z7_9HYME|nr:hypothetical protein ALC56_10090 [Trachymyrmex septentrionalis]